MNPSRTLAGTHFDALRRVASNYAWTWDQRLRSVLTSALGDHWSEGGHPLVALESLDSAARASIEADAALAGPLAEAVAVLDGFEKTADSAVEIAYFSPEFGISDTLPQYSGGLGILAGDHLKAASDLSVPLVGVGLFYANGYFVQDVVDGKQTVSFDKYEPSALGLEATGAVITVETPRGTVRAAVWLCRVGSIRLYVLDCRTPGNPRWARAITDKLYGGDQQRRIDQEWLLGVGGYRALQALGIHSSIVHLNEGHAGFCLLELFADRLSQGDDLAAAREAVRARTLFTTHTPVPAGIDRFPRSLLEPYLADWSATTGVSIDDLWPLGILPSDGDPDTFNMAAFALQDAGITNGVAALHGEVSRELFSSLPDAAAITSVTNGVHARTWVAPKLQPFFDQHLGAGWDLGDEAAWAKAASISDADLASVRGELRQILVDDLAARGFGGFDPSALTVGFARRFATYKRAALLLREKDKLVELLADDERPIQFVFAGKAHPADIPGQTVLAEIAAFAASPEARGRFVLVPGYDMHVASLLYGGCDVWLNNPVRPQEACGTSGEKAALNGGINCSIEDGWWAEWCNPANGWALPTSDLVDPEARDDAEAAGLLATLADEVVPQFYAADSTWRDRVRVGWTYLGPRVTAARMVAEYRDRLYTPLVERSVATTSATPSTSTD